MALPQDSKTKNSDEDDRRGKKQRSYFGNTICGKRTLLACMSCFRTCSWILSEWWSSSSSWCDVHFKNNYHHVNSHLHHSRQSTSPAVIIFFGFSTKFFTLQLLATSPAQSRRPRWSRGSCLSSLVKAFIFLKRKTNLKWNIASHRPIPYARTCKYWFITFSHATCLRPALYKTHYNNRHQPPAAAFRHGQYYNS